MGLLWGQWGWGLVRQALTLRSSLVKNRKICVFETTLSGNSEIGNHMSENQDNRPVSPLSEVQNDKWEHVTYFCVSPVKFKITGYDGSENYYWLVREIDIEKLPIYDFWKESTMGSTCMLDDHNPGKYLIYVHDWERFCTLFINTGKHRYNLYSA